MTTLPSRRPRARISSHALFDGVDGPPLVTAVFGCVGASVAGSLPPVKVAVVVVVVELESVVVVVVVLESVVVVVVVLESVVVVLESDEVVLELDVVVLVSLGAQTMMWLMPCESPSP